MKSLFIIVLSTFIVGLFLYSKLLPYKDRLNDRYSGIFKFFSSVFTPILNGLGSLIKPFKVGTNLSVDMTQIVLLILFLLLLNSIR